MASPQTLQLVDSTLLQHMNTKYYQIGQPFHIHSGKTHPEQLWACSSPYCEQIRGVDPPEEGGPQVIQKGQEPWRGK